VSGPAMHCLPNVGSFFAEVLVAGVELVRKALDIIPCAASDSAHVGRARDMSSHHAWSLSDTKMWQRPAFARQLL
jgi:hypothetical protein